MCVNTKEDMSQNFVGLCDTSYNRRDSVFLRFYSLLSSATTGEYRDNMSEQSTTTSSNIPPDSSFGLS
jgi:hypothetical protein